MKCIKLYEEQSESDLFQSELVFSLIAQNLLPQGAFRSLANLRQTCKKADAIIEKNKEIINQSFYRKCTYAKSGHHIISEFFNGNATTEYFHSSTDVSAKLFSFYKKNNQALVIMVHDSEIYIHGNQKTTISLEHLSRGIVYSSVVREDLMEVVDQNGYLTSEMYDILDGKYSSEPLVILDRDIFRCYPPITAD